MNATRPKTTDVKRITILDIARATGVSKSSVSRFLDDRLPVSHSETAELVRKTAAEMGYVRDMSASNLRRGTTGMIGVIVPRLTDTVMALLYEAISRAANRTGRFTIVATTNDDENADRRAVEMLLARGVDGLILSTTKHGDNLPTELASRGVPFVLALRTDSVHPSAVGDDRLGGYLATRHLIDLGHTRIGVIAGPQLASSATGRVAGYRDAMKEAGLMIDQDWIASSTFSIEAGFDAAMRLMDTPRRPTAIFAVNDNTAIGASSALARRGLRIPEDISLVGYNDIPIVAHLPKPLTTVRVPFDNIASAALERLTLAETLSIEPVYLAAPTLIPRASTSQPSGGPSANGI